MKFLLSIYLMIFGKKVGSDKYNNSYYEVISKHNRIAKRFIIYKGLNEPTKVPPEWESWLRFSTKKPITVNKITNNYFLPNLTGTVYRYTYTHNVDTQKSRSRSSWKGKSNNYE